MPIIFHGSPTVAYRDPTCIWAEGRYHLFFTVSQKENGYMYNFVAHSESQDLRSFSDPVILTEKDCRKNFCSPGNVIRVGDAYRICVCSYPMPVPYEQRGYADDTARLYWIETRDFVTFTQPRRILAKGSDCADEGRMIDPFVLEDKDRAGRYLLFFKQHGVSMSESFDLENWSYLGHVEGGENASVVVENGQYHLIHSPHNGIGHKVSEDLQCWTDLGVCLPKETEAAWANGRLTAAFAMKNRDPAIPYRYLVFFHGSRRDSTPETHGDASLAFYYTDDFRRYVF